MQEAKNEYKKPLIRFVVAASDNGVIGRDNTLIWHLPADLKWFKEKTTGFPVIMGRKTFESVGRPLPNRRNIIITRDSSYNKEGIETVTTKEQAISLCENEERISIIGGGEIYRLFMDDADEIYLTRVHQTFDGDTFFPTPDDSWELTFEDYHEPDEKNKIPFSFLIFRKKGLV